jgi:hypothetical protein
MKYLRFVLSAAAIAGLAACAAPTPPAPVANPFVTSITKYDHTEINEAASAYVSLYRKTIELSLSERRYKEDLAYKHLSAEACFDSRASRLMDKKTTQEEKNALILSVVSPDKLREYEGLSKGYFTRVNGLEILSCDTAGLKVSQRDLRH